MLLSANMIAVGTIAYNVLVVHSGTMINFRMLRAKKKETLLSLISLAVLPVPLLPGPCSQSIRSWPYFRGWSSCYNLPYWQMCRSTATSLRCSSVLYWWLVSWHCLCKNTGVKRNFRNVLGNYIGVEGIAIFGWRSFLIGNKKIAACGAGIQIWYANALADRVECDRISLGMQPCRMASKAERAYPKDMGK